MFDYLNGDFIVFLILLYDLTKLVNIRSLCLEILFELYFVEVQQGEKKGF